MKQQQTDWHRPSCSVRSRGQLLVSSLPGKSEADISIPLENLHFDHTLIAALVKKLCFKFKLNLLPCHSQSCKLLLNIPLPGCLTEHMVCEAVFRFFLNASEHVLPANDRFSSLCALDGNSGGCHPTSTKRERIFRIQTNKSHHSSLSVALTWFLSFTSACFDVFFFFF